MALIDRIPVCEHGNKNLISRDLILSLGRLETELNSELEFSSGFRCPFCNAKAGGVKKSAHVVGKAGDAMIDNSYDRFDILEGAFKVGYRRIGIHRRFVHLDVDTDLPQKVLWLY